MPDQERSLAQDVTDVAETYGLNRETLEREVERVLTRVMAEKIAQAEIQRRAAKGESEARVWW